MPENRKEISRHIVHLEQTDEWTDMTDDYESVVYPTDVLMK